MNEIETKVLNIDAADIRQKMAVLDAKLIQDTKLTVDWFGPAEIYNQPNITEGHDKWFLRIRKDSQGKVELTWKGKSEVLGVSRSHKEINFSVGDYENAAEFLIAIGLVNYAHQEKYRTSWIYQQWRFDLDSYPKMPPYLEIEGNSEQHIQGALQLLGLQDHKTSSQGERILIQQHYNLDWYSMKF